MSVHNTFVSSAASSSHIVMGQHPAVPADVPSSLTALRSGVAQSSTSSTSAAAFAMCSAAVAAGAKVTHKRNGAKKRSTKTARLQAAVPLAEKTNVEINYYTLDAVDAESLKAKARAAVEAGAGVIQEIGVEDPERTMLQLLCNPALKDLLVSVSRQSVFSHEFGLAFKDDLLLLSVLKQLKYFWNLPQSQVAILLEHLAQQLSAGATAAASFSSLQAALAKKETHLKTIKDLEQELPSEVRGSYKQNADYLETADPHAVYPTSIYRQCDALTLATEDASTIESVMSTTITTTIKIAREVLDPSNTLLYDIYKPLGRCVAVVDDKIEALYGDKLDAYFSYHGIEYVKLVFSGNEVDKDITDVERVLVALKKMGQARHEPLLVIGGGVIADIAGFACALYSRNTPYVMLCTSIVSGIDAGPSPRVCCNGFDYKNLYGAFHPPVLTITDRSFWKTLHPGWLRHGVAEIIKMAVMKDMALFELMEKWGKKCLETNFGTLGESVNDAEFQDICDLIVGKAMEGYVRSEYGNLWETHQCRPHAYGHTWSPGYELPSGMLHGQAVGTCMGFGAYLSYKEGWVSEEEMHRVLKVISDCELALWHPVMEDTAAVWKAQVGIVEKRGGNLCAPIPKPVGESGYLNDLPQDMLNQRMEEYEAICMKYPRGGRGVEEHCVDVGLEDPQAKKAVSSEPDRFVVTPMDLVATNISSASKVAGRGTTSEILDETLCLVDGVDHMVTKYSSQPSESLRNISINTAKTNPLWAEMEQKGETSRLMEAEMISGQAEGQLLQLLLKLGGGKRVLDIGTFTGYSSLAMAEALPADGKVVTLEREAEAADMAKKNWASSEHASKIESRVGEGRDLLQALAAEEQSFDLIFLDVDKPGYLELYQLLMDTNLLKVGGLLVVDNTMYKGEELAYSCSGSELSTNGLGAKALNEGLLADDRVHQVMLPLRDGVTIAYRQS